MALPYRQDHSRSKRVHVDNRQSRDEGWLMSDGHLLIVWHSRTGASEALARAAAEGAQAQARLLRARDVEATDLLEAQGYLFVCPENLASLSGEMKEMFDRCYYPVLGKIEGRPFATIIAAGSDGEGSQRQIDRIARGWRLKRVSEPRIVCTHAQTEKEILAPKILKENEIRMARELGEAMAAGIEQGIF